MEVDKNVFPWLVCIGGACVPVFGHFMNEIVETSYQCTDRGYCKKAIR